MLSLLIPKLQIKWSLRGYFTWLGVYLVVVQVEKRQVTHLVEGASRDLRNTIST